MDNAASIKNTRVACRYPQMTVETPTIDLFKRITSESEEIFQDKLSTYGPSLMIFRCSSLIDKLWIKASRIRHLEELDGENKINEGRRSEYLAIINYSTVTLMKLWYPEKFPDEFPASIIKDNQQIESGYKQTMSRVEELLMNKNHDYGSAWKQMDVSSLTDIILDKILRMKSEIPQKDTTSEDLASELVDIVNYAVFAVAKLDSDISHD